MKCAECGSNMFPVTYKENGKTMVSHIECSYCGRKECTSDMTLAEYKKMERERYASKL